MFIVTTTPPDLFRKPRRGGMACARWHHAAPTGLAEISVRAGYKHVAPLGLVSFGGRPPPSPTARLRPAGAIMFNC